MDTRAPHISIKHQEASSYLEWQQYDSWFYGTDGYFSRFISESAEFILILCTVCVFVASEGSNQAEHSTERASEQPTGDVGCRWSCDDTAPASGAGQPSHALSDAIRVSCCPPWGRCKSSSQNVLGCSAAGCGHLHTVSLRLGLSLFGAVNFCIELHNVFYVSCAALHDGVASCQMNSHGS